MFHVIFWEEGLGWLFVLQSSGFLQFLIFSRTSGYSGGFYPTGPVMCMTCCNTHGLLPLFFFFSLVCSRSPR